MFSLIPLTDRALVILILFFSPSFIFFFFFPSFRPSSFFFVGPDVTRLTGGSCLVQSSASDKQLKASGSFVSFYFIFFFFSFHSGFLPVG